MLQRSQTGHRIRARRLEQGRSQQDLAQAAGISASYLNLIEHDRRRISGRVLGAIAAVLGIDPVQLAQQVDVTPLQGLGPPGEEEPADVFADRFPGWARVVVDQAAQITALEVRVMAMADRMAHDPVLAGTLHQVLSTVTSIRSTASILVEGAGDLDWEARFHKNVYADSLRLADVSQALVTYLEAPDAPLEQSATEEASAFMQARGHHIAACEAGEDVNLGAMSDPAQAVMGRWLAQYRADAQALPLAQFAEAAMDCGYDPGVLGARFDVGLPNVLRRLACLPPDAGHPQVGLAVCDGAGVLTRFKGIDGFDRPHVGGACPLWPLYQALGQPGRAIREVVVMPGDARPRLTGYAVATPVGAMRFDGCGATEAVMIVVADAPGGPPKPVGPGCSLCPRQECAARRA